MRTTFLVLGLALALAAQSAMAEPAYRLAKTTPLGAPDRWDYVVFDGETGRVYAAHGDRLAVLDARSGDLVGQVEGIAGGAHGVGVSLATNQGFTDDGSNGAAVVFDLKTLKITARIPTDKDADGIAVDRVSGKVFIVNGDPASLSVIDPRTDTLAATIKVGETMEYAASDGQGAVFVAGKEKRDVVKIDVGTDTVVAHWPTPDCASPHGLAIDRAGRRLFMGCLNARMMVIDANTGHVVAELPIGRGSDAVAFDAGRKRVFSSNGLDGTISVFQQAGPDIYTPLEPVRTKISARTMDVDRTTGRLFVLAADLAAPTAPGAKPRPEPGTLTMMAFDPVGP
jgi:DNA-binding beta-propeller fold protein YncE